jgi:hypothetical protein
MLHVAMGKVLLFCSVFLTPRGLLQSLRRTAPIHLESRPGRGTRLPLQLEWYRVAE